MVEKTYHVSPVVVIVASVVDVAGSPFSDYYWPFRREVVIQRGEHIVDSRFRT